MIEYETGKDFLPIRRVRYGKPSTPVKDREYRVEGVPNSPVGTTKEWLKFAKDNGFAGIKAFESDGSVTFDFVKGCRHTVHGVKCKVME